MLVACRLLLEMEGKDKAEQKHRDAGSRVARMAGGGFMWTLMWGLLTLALFGIALVNMPIDVNALLVVMAIGSAGVFGFSLSVTVARRRQQRERDPSQPKRSAAQ